jgi:hypothetical protein
VATLYASANVIQARAKTLDPVKVLITLVSLLPFLVFYVARFVWLVASLLIAAGMEGWDSASRRIAAQHAAGSRNG